MFFRQVLHAERSCASYVIGCQSQGTCAVVDPQGDPRAYMEMAAENGLEVDHVIETHVQADHPSGARELAKLADAPLRLSVLSEVRFDFEPVADGDMIEIGNRRVEVLATPGHTPEHMTLLVDDWFVLTGDTLFVGDVGRVDLALEEIDPSKPIERAKTLYGSLQRLLELPDHVEVYPGHYAGSTCGRGMDGKTISTIGRERRYNPALQLDQADFATFLLDNAPPLPEDYLRIKRENLGLVLAR